MKQIAPSILSADFTKLGEEIAAVEKAGADLIHVDIMDGHFVPNLTMGPPLVKSIRKITKLPLDCHLMIDNPEKFIEPFAKAGADWISVHVEACNLAELLPAIKKLGCKAGAVINPPTPLKKILPFCERADFVLIMTVNPGFGGQAMVEGTLEKIAALKKYLTDQKLNIPIEVDGGVKLENIADFADAGADIFVAGSGVFHTGDYKKTIAQMKK
ncbi:MAG: ribulose-phosphate 3-epimerase [Deltaproteobacteria bacterium]|nr:ribulose-phosphate 3-epimerase [Deltaproteobacteria bacterium]MBI4223453.1 ribulose-phosphate 3-epimerase [Deltaproteobacteria bacterium]